MWTSTGDFNLLLLKVDFLVFVTCFCLFLASLLFIRFLFVNYTVKERKRKRTDFWIWLCIASIVTFRWREPFCFFLMVVSGHFNKKKMFLLTFGLYCFHLCRLHHWRSTAGWQLLPLPPWQSANKTRSHS